MSGNDKEELEKLLSSAVLVFIGTIFSSFFGLVERIAIGRLLSPASYGEFSLALAIFTLTTTLGIAGFNQGVPRYMSRFEDYKDIRGAWLTGLLITSGFSLMVVATIILSGPVLIPLIFESEESSILVLIFSAAIPFWVISKIGISAIRGCENTVYKIITEDICYPLIRTTLIMGFIILGFGVISTSLGYFISLLIISAITYIFLNRLFPLLGSFRLHIREMTIFSAPLMISTAMTILLTKTDTLMLGYFRSSAEVGIYNAAYPLAGVLTIILGAFGFMYLPVASRLDSNDEGSVERIYELTTKWVFIAALPLFVLLFVFPSEIISFIFGNEYETGGKALAILATGFFSHAAVGRNRETLSALGATTFIMIANVSSFIVNIFLNILLIPIYGFIGAALASAFTFITLGVIVYAFLRSYFDITPFNHQSIKIVLVAPIPLLFLGFIIRNFFGGSMISIILLLVITPAVLFVTIVSVGGIESEDIVLVEFIEEAMNVHIPIIRRFIPTN